MYKSALSLSTTAVLLCIGLAFLASTVEGAKPRQVKTITLEHAATAQQQAWGLMQRKGLPPNHGMLFTYSSPRLISMWSFNCLMDLSVAFLDEKKVIRQISFLKAYPELMDPFRPVKKISDITLYNPQEPIMFYFKSHAVKSKRPCLYALEMSKSWFEENDVRPGDRLVFEENGSSATIIPR